MLTPEPVRDESIREEDSLSGQPPRTDQAQPLAGLHAPLRTGVGDGSVSRVMADMRNQRNDKAAQFLFQRYYQRLVLSMQQRISRTFQGVVDSEDLAQYALNEVFHKLESGKYPELGNRDSLWALMMRIAINRSKHEMRAYSAQGRDVRRTQSMHAADEGDANPGVDPAHRGATADIEVELRDLLNHLATNLSKPEFRELLELELHDYAPGEMQQLLSEKLGKPIHERTLHRWRERMHDELKAAYPDDCDTF